MNILIVGDKKQYLCEEFRTAGHMAFTASIEPCFGDYPEWHIKGNFYDLFKGDCLFKTMDGIIHKVLDWDFIIAFPGIALFPNNIKTP